MPGLGQFGEREPDHTPRTGKRTGRLSPSRLTRAKGRDTLLEEELRGMTEALKGRDQFICIDTLREQKKPEGRSRNPNRPTDAGVFGQPEQDKIRPPRLRPDFSDTALQKLTAVDTRKSDAAQVMQSDYEMIDKMVACNYPIPRKPESPKHRKKSFSGREAEPEVAVEGFKGLGAKSKAHLPRSKAAGPSGPFVPEFAPAARTSGKKSVPMPGSGAYEPNATGEPNRNISNVF